jgi:hypothetical protein
MDLFVTLNVYMTVIDRAGNVSMLVSIDGGNPYWLDMPDDGGVTCRSIGS